MNRIDTIIDALECAKQQTIKGVMYPAGYHMMLAQALAAARELWELKPVAWCVERKVATCNEKYAELWRSNGEGVTPLYALDEVKHD